MTRIFLFVSLVIFTIWEVFLLILLAQSFRGSAIAVLWGCLSYELFKLYIDRGWNIVEAVKSLEEA